MCRRDCEGPPTWCVLVFYDGHSFHRDESWSWKTQCADCAWRDSSNESGMSAVFEECMPGPAPLAHWKATSTSDGFRSPNHAKVLLPPELTRDRKKELMNLVPPACARHC